MAEASAMEEPEIPEKKISETTTTKSQPSLDMSHQVFGKLHQPLGDSPLLHQAPGQDEKRNGQKREGVDPRIELQGDRRDRNRSLPEKGQDTGQGHAEGDRNVDDQQEDESRKENDNGAHEL